VVLDHCSGEIQRTGSGGFWVRDAEFACPLTVASRKSPIGGGEEFRHAYFVGANGTNRLVFDIRDPNEDLIPASMRTSPPIVVE
jgi:hypothetical protein